MMNSPCAMLMTPIWPKVNDRPSARSSSTAPMLTPVKSWLRTSVTGRTSEIARDRGGRARWTRPPPWLSGQAGGPAVALEVRVRLDRLAGVPHFGDESVGADLADPGRLEHVLRRAVDGDQTLRCVEGDPAAVRGRLDLRYVEGAGLLDHRLPRV